MNSLVYWAATFALGCFVLALVFAALRLLHGPASTDRVLALDTMYINGMLILLVLGLQRSEEHTSELQSLMRISYAVFCLKKKKKISNSQYSRYTHHHNFNTQ